MKRVIPGSLIAFAVCVLLIVTANYCFPLCAIYTDSNPEWYLFQCWTCAP